MAGWKPAPLAAAMQMLVAKAKLEQPFRGEGIMPAINYLPNQLEPLPMS